MITWIKSRTNSLVIGLLCFICLFLIYSWMDARITIDQAWRTVEAEKNDALVLRELLQVVGKKTTRNEMTLLINKQIKKGHVIKEEADQLSVDGIILKFEGDTLIEVRFINE